MLHDVTESRFWFFLSRSLKSSKCRLSFLFRAERSNKWASKRERSAPGGNKKLGGGRRWARRRMGWGESLAVNLQNSVCPRTGSKSAIWLVRNLTSMHYPISGTRDKIKIHFLFRLWFSFRGWRTFTSRKPCICTEISVCYINLIELMYLRFSNVDVIDVAIAFKCVHNNAPDPFN